MTKLNILEKRFLVRTLESRKFLVIDLSVKLTERQLDEIAFCDNLIQKLNRDE